MAVSSTFTLSADLELADSAAVLASLAEAVENAPRTEGLELELSGDSPTQPALQLFFAALADLRRAGTPIQFGTNAAQIMTMEVRDDKDG